ncbi:MAG: GlsB/YeaQ/YmgE family stress response membrane protein [bacterium]|nr:GlsB/YeaQ/YmgE family stress response membrane protein [bacterium]
MSIILWLVFGALVGWIASLIMGTDAQQGAIMNIVVGIVGAVLGGWLFSLFGAQDVSGFNIYSFIVALVGAVVLLGLYQAVRRSSARI